jgi:hypothetical protein
MTFITRCPYPECRKYLLLEDHDRGTTVECLCCKRPINLASGVQNETYAGDSAPPAASGSSPPPRPGPSPGPPASPAPASPPSAPARQYPIRHCPKCNTAMRVPPTTAGQAVQCPTCQHVF